MQKYAFKDMTQSFSSCMKTSNNEHPIQGYPSIVAESTSELHCNSFVASQHIFWWYGIRHATFETMRSNVLGLAHHCLLSVSEVRAYFLSLHVETISRVFQAECQDTSQEAIVELAGVLTKLEIFLLLGTALQWCLGHQCSCLGHLQQFLSSAGLSNTAMQILGMRRSQVEKNLVSCQVLASGRRWGQGKIADAEIILHAEDKRYGAMLTLAVSQISIWTR